MADKRSPRAEQPYGSWKSSITADLIAAEAVGLGAPWFDGEDIYWTEQRGAEGGRTVIVRRYAAGVEDVLPPPYSARSRVNEYGGGAFTVSDGVVYFVNNADQRVYRLRAGSAAVALTPADARRYGDLFLDRSHGRVLAVCEDHRVSGEPPQSIVAINAAGDAPPATLASGHDFYAAPRLSADARALAFIAWDHPNMPWDGTRLYRADVASDGTVGTPIEIAGSADESIVQPAFAPDGHLYFISDRSGWWNLHRQRDGAIESVHAHAAEYAAPPWVFGLSTYAFISGDRIACACNERGSWHLVLLDLVTSEATRVPLLYNDIGYVRAWGERVVFLAAGAEELPAIVELDLASERVAVLRRSAPAPDAENVSPARPITYCTGDGEQAHGLFYRPRSVGAIGQRDERPPLIVMSHGGPTAAASPALNLKIQYWTSRGFAVLDVNYRGSTGYGRAYRRRLNDGWGVLDVEDCIAGARHLVAEGEVDGARLAIRGGSAGGYTTLCALTFHNVFRAGASHYGISDLELLVHDTHKFESRYLGGLVGPYPQAAIRYRERSPIHHAERISCPVIFFQGAEDRVVPPNQTERMVQALRARGIAVGYLLFPGEQHGFRRAENIVRALETELRFYGRVFGFITEVDERIADPLA